LSESAARAADSIYTDPYLSRLFLRFSDTDHPAPVDYGPGPGLPPPPASVLATATTSGTIPNGGPTAVQGGFFGPAVSWPIIPIHTVLLPDGRVMNFGTSETGAQGAALIYDVWDPTLGTGSNAHLILPNTTGTDIFCSAQSVMAETGQVLTSGGDLTINGQRNYSQNHTTIFSPQSDTIASGPSMQYPRWYASMIPLATGQKLVLGGRTAPGDAAITPEVYDPTGGWTTLTGATSNAAFNITALNWYYPRGFVTAKGPVFVLGADGSMYSLRPSGTGTITQLAQTTLGGNQTLPTVMFASGKLMSVRNNQATIVVDVSDSDSPVVSPSGTISQNRYWANATLLPDGRTLVTGGSMVANVMTGIAYQAELWNPRTGQWTLGASAAKPRLYHSNALLLPDATVLTGGGGAPGPINELNAEIYYPSYLYRRDGSGQPAVRPTLVSAAATATLGQPFTARVGAGQTIVKVVMMRTGSATHSTNFDQRYENVPFTHDGTPLTVTPFGNANVMMPGYDMVFVLDRAGTPSVAKIVLAQP
jgi:hypothetical protein